MVMEPRRSWCEIQLFMKTHRWWAEPNATNYYVVYSDDCRAKRNWRSHSIYSTKRALTYWEHHVRHSTSSPSTTAKSHQSMEKPPKPSAVLSLASISGALFYLDYPTMFFFIHTFHGGIVGTIVLRKLIELLLLSTFDHCVSQMSTALWLLSLRWFGTLAVSSHLQSQFFLRSIYRNLCAIKLDGPL